jgi:hypothetical protein
MTKLPDVFSRSSAFCISEGKDVISTSTIYPVLL